MLPAIAHKLNGMATQKKRAETETETETDTDTDTDTDKNRAASYKEVARRKTSLQEELVQPTPQHRGEDGCDLTQARVGCAQLPAPDAAVLVRVPAPYNIYTIYT